MINYVKMIKENYTENDYRINKLKNLISCVRTQKNVLKIHNSRTKNDMGLKFGSIVLLKKQHKIRKNQISRYSLGKRT